MHLKNSLRWLLYLIGLVLAIMTIAALVIRFFVFPNINNYKNDIADFATKTVGQKLTIGQIITGWDGISPQVILKNVDLYDEQNRSALHLNQINTSLSWLSMPMLEARFSKISLVKPELSIRRATDGSLFVAGIKLAGESRPALGNWLLRQGKVLIENAKVVWYDDLRQAPPLSLNQLNLSLTSPALKGFFGQHKFAVSALPSVGSQQKILFDGQFFGRDISKISQWYGDMHAKVSNTDLAIWRPWLDYKIQNRAIDIQSGTGDTEVWLAFTQSHIKEVKTVSKLNQFSILLPNNTTPFIAEYFSGELTWSNHKTEQLFSAKKLQLKTNTGINIHNGTGYLTRTNKNNQPWLEANIQLDQLNLQAITLIAPYLNLATEQLAQINGLAPKGTLSETTIALSGPENAPNQYDINTTFKDFGLSAYNKIPGFSQLSGSIKANEKGGQLRLNTEKAMLDLKGILRWPVPADVLTGLVSWRIKNGKADFTAKDVYIQNPHLTSTVNAHYDMNGAKGGFLDLNVAIEKADAKHALFYYPISLGADTLHWLDSSIKAGRIEKGLVAIKGPAVDFPFADAKGAPNPKLGYFKATAALNDALLDYGQGWPALENLNLALLFEGSRAAFTSNKARILGSQITKCTAQIAQLDADWPILSIKGEVVSSLKDSIKFINNSPVKDVTLGFTDHLTAAGNGKLDLALSIPLQKSDDTKIKGAYHVTDATLFANEDIGLPELSKLNGTIKFTETGISAQDISTKVLGSPAKFSLKTAQDKTIFINANGRIDQAGIKKLLNTNWVDTLQGSTDWTGLITIKKPYADMVFKSNLAGMAVNLPAPFGKTAAQTKSFVFEKDQTSESTENMLIHYGTLANVFIMRSLQGKTMQIERGDIGIAAPENRPTQKGFAIHGKLDDMNADEWLNLISKHNPAGLASSGADKDHLNISKLDVAVQKMQVFQRNIHQLKMTSTGNNSATGNDLQFALNSKEINGNVEWQAQGRGKIIANLKNLVIPAADDNINQKNSEKKEIQPLNQIYPALEITADNFQLGAKSLGSLTLNAFESDHVWIIQKLKISNPDSELMAEGSWYNGVRSPSTNLQFSLNVSNIGKTLKRFGQPDTVKGGEASLSGQLKWAGSPHEFDVEDLSGNVELAANKGQFLKVQPGVGRLLGLLSLQSLPRRLSLDFRDLFSDGFAFDQISAKANIHKGILRSDDFYMSGPAADVKIKGETNLKAETQRLNVKVKPNVSDSISLAAFAGGPIVGVAAFVAQKLLKDPLNKIAGSEYEIAGTWSNPQEVKLEQEKDSKSTSSPLTQ